MGRASRKKTGSGDMRSAADLEAEADAILAAADSSQEIEEVPLEALDNYSGEDPANIVIDSIGEGPDDDQAPLHDNSEDDDPISSEEIKDALDGVSLESLPLHLRNIGRYELLSPEEEKELAERIAKGDKEAKDKMIQSNLRLVVAIARRYQGHSIELNDLIQEGSIGLIRAVEKFDHTRNLRFSTYATWWVRQAVVRSLDDKSRSVRLPVHVAEKIHKLRSRETKLAAKLGRDPLPEELARELEWEVEEVQEIRRLQNQRTVSLDKPVGSDEEDATLGDMIPDEHTPSPLEEADASIRAETLSALLEQLPEREQEVLRMRYGLQGQSSMTLAEIGKELGITRERVYQIENSAKKRLSMMPEAESLRS